MAIIQVERERLAAIMRLLVDDGHLTPQGVRQINAVLDDEVKRNTTDWRRHAANMLRLSAADDGEPVYVDGKCIICERPPETCPKVPADCFMVGLLGELRDSG